MEKLNFYSHYCDVDFIILDTGIDFINDELKSAEIDICIAYQFDLISVENRIKAQWLSFFQHDDFDLFFDKLYSLLSVE